MEKEVLTDSTKQNFKLVLAEGSLFANPTVKQIIRYLLGLFISSQRVLLFTLWGISLLMLFVFGISAVTQSAPTSSVNRLNSVETSIVSKPSENPIITHTFSQADFFKFYGYISIAFFLIKAAFGKFRKKKTPEPEFKKDLNFRQRFKKYFIRLVILYVLIFVLAIFAPVAPNESVGLQFLGIFVCLILTFSITLYFLVIDSVAKKLSSVLGLGEMF